MPWCSEGLALTAEMSAKTMRATLKAPSSHVSGLAEQYLRCARQLTAGLIASSEQVIISTTQLFHLSPSNKIGFGEAWRKRQHATFTCGAKNV